MRYNFISLHDRIRRRSDALQFAQEKDIIKSTSKCKTCASSLKVQYSQANTSYVFFYCPQCKTKESVKKDTFLYNKVSPFTQYCLLISILEHLHQVVPVDGDPFHPDAEHDYSSDHLSGFRFDWICFTDACF